MNSIRTFGFSVAILLGLITGANAANIVVNGDFGTGDLSGWTTTDWTAGTGPLGTVVPDVGSTYAAFNGCIDFCDLSQDLPTQPGQSYFVTFAFNPGITENGGNEMQAYWDGAQIFDQSGGPTEWDTQLYVLTASGNNTELRFSGFQAAWSAIDAVDVEAVELVTIQGVPEPATWTMLLLGFAGLGYACRRQSSRRLTVA
jgi:hypothetical protein